VERVGGVVAAYFKVKSSHLPGKLTEPLKSLINDNAP
jgi:hypothetical protein